MLFVVAPLVWLLLSVPLAIAVGRLLARSRAATTRPLGHDEVAARQTSSSPTGGSPGTHTAAEHARPGRRAA